MGLSLNMHANSAQFQFNSDSHKTIKIGRLQTAQVVLDDPSVARVHAVIELSATEATFIDMGSTQGSLVNGKKEARIKLKVGDTLTIGNTTLVVDVLGAVQASVPTSPSTQASVATAAIVTPVPQVVPAVAPVSTTVANVQGQPTNVAPSGPPADASAQHDMEQAREHLVRQVGQSRLRASSAQAQEHPSLPTEDAMTRDNRVLELRYYWGEVLLGMNHYTRPKQVTIGETKQSDIFLSSEGLPAGAFPLIRYRDDEYLLGFTDKMRGEVETPGHMQSFEQLIAQIGKSDGATKDAELEGSYTVKLANDARALLHWGGATFAMRFVAPPRILPAPWGQNIDLQFVNSSLFSIFGHIAFIVMLALYPHNQDALKVDLFDSPDRFASLILEPPKETQSALKMLEKIKKQVEEKKTEIQPQEEKPQTQQEKATQALKTPVKIPTNSAAAHAQSVADKRQAVAQKFSKLLGGGAGQLLGGGGGGSLSGTLQNVIGTAGNASASGGLAGLGIRGSGPLTGGGNGSSKGLAGIGTIGKLGGGAAGYGSGVGLGSGKGQGLIDLETPTIEGALSADVIKRVINENKNQIRYCYEVELQHNQSLEGRIEMHWIIAADGSVSAVNVKDSSIKNANVENCLMRKIRTWKFPQPAGGGVVEVNYPFVFKAS